MGLKKTAIYRRIAKRSFPAPVSDEAYTNVCWLESESMLRSLVEIEKLFVPIRKYIFRAVLDALFEIVDGQIVAFGVADEAAHQLDHFLVVNGFASVGRAVGFCV